MTKSAMATDSQPLTPAERVALAQQLYDEFRVQCFWYSPRDLVITEELIPFVWKGLRANGGHRGFILSGKLRPAAQDGRECH